MSAVSRKKQYFIMRLFDCWHFSWNTLKKIKICLQLCNTFSVSFPQHGDKLLSWIPIYCFVKMYRLPTNITLITHHPPAFLFPSKNHWNCIKKCTHRNVFGRTKSTEMAPFIEIKMKEDEWTTEKKKCFQYQKSNSGKIWIDS